MKKIFLGTNFGSKLAKTRLKISFFVIFSSLVHQFSFKLHRMIAWNNVQLLVEVKLSKNILQTQIWAKQAKIGSKIRGFFFLALVHQFFFIIALDDSLERCLITSRGKTCKKNWWPKFELNGPKYGPKLGVLSFF